MSKPSAKKCAVLIQHNEYNIRVARVGVGPLVEVWVHEDGNGGRGIILSVEQTEVLIEGLNDLLDEIEGWSRRAG